MLGKFIVLITYASRAIETRELKQEVSDWLNISTRLLVANNEHMLAFNVSQFVLCELKGKREKIQPGDTKVN